MGRREWDWAGGAQGRGGARSGVRGRVRGRSVSPWRGSGAESQGYPGEELRALRPSGPGPVPCATHIPGIPVALAALAAVAWRLRGAASARSPAAGTWRRRPEFPFPRRRYVSSRAFPGMSLAEGERLHLPGVQGLGGTVPTMLFSRGGCRAGEVSAYFHLPARMEASDPVVLLPWAI